jgi:phage shock protein C
MPRKSRRLHAVREPKRLYRSTKDRILGGVCGGIAEYFNVDPTIVRILWIFFTLLWGAGLLLYIILWIIMPKKPEGK